jgi:hypothetical protein
VEKAQLSENKQLVDHLVLRASALERGKEAYLTQLHVFLMRNGRYVNLCVLAHRFVVLRMCVVLRVV